MASIHELRIGPGSVHGVFSRELAPALRVDSGDIVRLSTLDCDWGLEPRTAVRAPRRRFAPRLERDTGHALTGPIAVRGARPGGVLEVAIHKLIPGPYGFTAAGGHRPGSGIDAEIGVSDLEPTLLAWSLDREAGLATSAEGFTVPLGPFLGVIGMPPDEPGLHSSTPPRACGGNIDCKELIVGSRLFLPVSVPEALLSVGDGHAAQGDGELSVNAIECPMDEVELALTYHDDLHLVLPRAWTPTAWITFGFDVDLDRAVDQAVRGMLDLVVARFGVSRAEALALASVAVDVRVTQVANGVRGAHAVLGHGVLRKA